LLQCLRGCCLCVYFAKNKRMIDLIYMRDNDFLIEEKGTTAEVYLYGSIGEYLDIDTNKLIYELERLRKRGIKNYLFYVNSDGGEVLQGYTLFNYLDRTEVGVTFVVDGVAASMMAMLLTNPKHRVKAAKHAKFMYHRIHGYVSGNSTEVRAHADMMDTFEASLIEMMATRMKVDVSEVKEKFFNDGIDHWLSAEEAKELGLVDEILVGGRVIQEPKNLNDKREVFNYYKNQIINLKKTKMTPEKEKNIYALALGMSQDEDESKIIGRLQNLVSENGKLSATVQSKDKEIETLKAELQSFRDEKVTNMINEAIADKKIGEDERETYTVLAEKDFEATKKVLSKLPVVDRLVNRIDDDQSKSGGVWEKRQKEIEEGNK
jgi:ATP-dependent Clp endopeptidase proteolytic subunit ClpP